MRSTGLVSRCLGLESTARVLLVPLVLAACNAEKPREPSARVSPPNVTGPSSVEGQPADSFEKLSSAAFSRWAALYYLRKEVNAERAAWPTDEEPELDFRKAEGNAIIVHHESGKHENPFEVLTKGAAFKLFHIEDDPYRLAYSAGDLSAKPEDKAKYRADQYKPALEQILRAKYAVFIVGKVKQPEVFAGSFTPGKLEGVGVLYEIESKKLLGGFPLAASSSHEVRTRTGDYANQEHDAVLHDFENNARAALWTAIKARFPSVKLPTIVYLDSKE